jgi:hypothetical protein
MRCSALLHTAVLALVAADAAAQSQFIIKKGKDTVAIEAFSRDASTLTSEIYQTNGLRTQYTANLLADKAVQHIEMSRQNRQGAGVSFTVHIGDTLVTANVTTAAGSEKMEVGTKGKCTPFLALSFALSEQILQASHLEVGQSLKWTAIRLGAGDTATLTVSRFHADSALLSTADMQIRLAVSKTGEVIGGRHVGQDWVIERKNGR